MAKSRRDELFDRMRMSGLRKSVARQLADALDSGRAPRKQVDDVLDRLRAVTADIEDRAKGGPTKRSAAAKKAAATRKRKATQRSAAGKKAAQTRARSSRTSTRSRSAS